MPTSVTHLVSRMTLEEKVAQLTSLDIMKMAMAVRGVDPADRGAALAARLPEIAPHGVGHFPTMLGMLAPGIDEAAGFYRQVQDGATAASRFAIPALIQVEALNGAVMPGAPTYPTGIAQAATWRPELVQRMADLTRQRLLGYGIRHALSSVLDLARDPRWGRVHETYGEDPDLIAALGVAFVRGMQSGDLRDGVAACAKHFIAYSASQGGLNQGGVAVGPRSLREQWARPFEAVIREADVATAMKSYSVIDGAPVAADPAMLTGLLRDELGFDGFVVSDYDSVGHLFSRQFVAEDAPAAAILALKAGLDTEFLNPVCFQHLPQLVRQGRLDEALIDRATRRVLEVKERLGLLDHILRHSSPTMKPAHSVPDPEQDLEHSRDMAHQAVVLLTNDGVLPLTRTRRVALIGELATEVRIHYGAYTGVAARETQTVTAQQRISDAAGDLKRLPTPGFPHRFDAMARELEPHAVSLTEAFDAIGLARLVHVPQGGPEGTSPDAVAQAAAAAQDADVAVVVVGERTGRVGPVHAGEGTDSQALCLPGDQERLVEAVAATGTPTVVVVVSGRPLLLGHIALHAAAIVWAPLLGPFAGTAVTDVLTGTVSPAGRLPISWPASLGQIPVFHGSNAGSGYDVPGGADSLGYGDGPARPLFPFGHGLSYTEFTYSDLEVGPVTKVGHDIEVAVTVSNTGGSDGRDVVQLYARDLVASSV